MKTRRTVSLFLLVVGLLAASTTVTGTSDEQGLDPAPAVDIMNEQSQGQVVSAIGGGSSGGGNTDEGLEADSETQPGGVEHGLPSEDGQQPASSGENQQPSYVTPVTSAEPVDTGTQPASSEQTDSSTTTTTTPSSILDIGDEENGAEAAVSTSLKADERIDVNEEPIRRRTEAEGEAATGANGPMASPADDSNSARRAGETWPEEGVGMMPQPNAMSATKDSPSWAQEGEKETEWESALKGGQDGTHSSSSSPGKKGKKAKHVKTNGDGMNDGHAPEHNTAKSPSMHQNNEMETEKHGKHSSASPEKKGKKGMHAKNTGDGMSEGHAPGHHSEKSPSMHQNGEMEGMDWDTKKHGKHSSSSPKMGKHDKNTAGTESWSDGHAPGLHVGNSPSMPQHGEMSEKGGMNGKHSSKKGKGKHSKDNVGSWSSEHVPAHHAANSQSGPQGGKMEGKEWENEKTGEHSSSMGGGGAKPPGTNPPGMESNGEGGKQGKSKGKKHHQKSSSHSQQGSSHSQHSSGKNQGKSHQTNGYPSTNHGQNNHGHPSSHNGNGHGQHGSESYDNSYSHHGSEGYDNGYGHHGSEGYGDGYDQHGGESYGNGYGQHGGEGYGNGYGQHGGEGYGNGYSHHGGEGYDNGYEQNYHHSSSGYGYGDGGEGKYDGQSSGEYGLPAYNDGYGGDSNGYEDNHVHDYGKDYGHQEYQSGSPSSYGSHEGHGYDHDGYANGYGGGYGEGGDGYSSDSSSYQQPYQQPSSPGSYGSTYQPYASTAYTGVAEGSNNYQQPQQPYQPPAQDYTQSSQSSYSAPPAYGSSYQQPQSITPDYSAPPAYHQPQPYQQPSPPATSNQPNYGQPVPTVNHQQASASYIQPKTSMPMPSYPASQQYGPSPPHSGNEAVQKKSSSNYIVPPYSIYNAHDTHYCSVFGSFALAFSNEYGSDYGGAGDSYSSPRRRRQAPSQYNSTVDSVHDTDTAKNTTASSSSMSGGTKHKRHVSYGGGYKPRYHTRQYCRYAAAASSRACHFCCRVVARSANTSPDEIVAAIFAFDPAEPMAGSYGSDGGYSSGSQDEHGEASYDSNSYGTKAAYQCVCCAPKPQEESYGIKTPDSGPY